MQRQLFLSLTFLLLFVNAGFAQYIEVKAKIEDAVTNNSISHATVTTADGAFGTMSNSEGFFRLYCPTGTKVIIIKHVGYKTQKIATEKLTEIVLLEPEQLMMDEAILSNIPIDVLLRELIENSINKLNTPIQLSTYYREFVKLNDNYTKFSDGLIDYQLSKKKLKVDTRMVVSQSRATELKKQEGELMIVGLGPDVRKAVDHDCSFYILDELLLKGKEYKKYNLSLKAHNEEGNYVEVITFAPKAGIEEALFEGSVIYNPVTKVILNVDVRMVPSLMQYKKERNLLIAKVCFENLVYKCSFKEINDNYLLSYSSVVGGIRIFNKKRSNTYSYNSDLIVTNFSTDNTKFTTPEKYKFRSLYERGSIYKEKYWLSNNSIVLTEEEEKIIQELNNLKRTEY